MYKKKLNKTAAIGLTNRWVYKYSLSWIINVFCLFSHNASSFNATLVISLCEVVLDATGWSAELLPINTICLHMGIQFCWLALWLIPWFPCIGMNWHLVSIYICCLTPSTIFCSGNANISGTLVSDVISRSMHLLCSLLKAVIQQCLKMNLTKTFLPVQAVLNSQATEATPTKKTRKRP